MVTTFIEYGAWWNEVYAAVKQWDTIYSSRYNNKEIDQGKYIVRAMNNSWELNPQSPAEWIEKAIINLGGSTTT